MNYNCYICYVQAGIHRRYVRRYYNARALKSSTITTSYTRAWICVSKLDYSKSTFCGQQSIEEALYQVCSKKQICFRILIMGWSTYTMRVVWSLFFFLYVCAQFWPILHLWFTNSQLRFSAYSTSFWIVSVVFSNINLFVNARFCFSIEKWYSSW